MCVLIRFIRGLSGIVAVFVEEIYRQRGGRRKVIQSVPLKSAGSFAEVCTGMPIRRHYERMGRNGVCGVWFFMMAGDAWWHEYS